MRSSSSSSSLLSSVVVAFAAAKAVEAVDTDLVVVIARLVAVIFGLQLRSLCRDGRVRIYRCLNQENITETPSPIVVRTLLLFPRHMIGRWWVVVVGLWSRQWRWFPCFCKAHSDSFYRSQRRSRRRGEDPVAVVPVIVIPVVVGTTVVPVVVFPVPVVVVAERGSCQDRVLDGDRGRTRELSRPRARRISRPSSPSNNRECGTGPGYHA